MAMVSMCFQLMQDEIMAKVRWLLQKLGFGKKDEGDKGEDDSAEESMEETTAVTDDKAARPKTAIKRA